MGVLWAIVISFLTCFHFVFSVTNVENFDSQLFIVRVQNDLKPLEFEDVQTWYSLILRSIAGLETDNPSKGEFLHVYKTVFHGFSAKMTKAEAMELEKRPEVIRVFPDRIHQLHTTRTPLFLGLDRASSVNCVAQESNAGSNVIIGVLDTGIWPEHPSFSDHGINNVPSRWKGECVEGDQFPKTLCNKKLIGARYFTKGYNAFVGELGEDELQSARDTIGHGTHTASTAAGRLVHNASFLGFANGSAMGVAPKARIAAYKVCGKTGCAGSDILAGFDKAVEDGVDVVSLSLGSFVAVPYEDDAIAIGSYAAMRSGIFVSASAGNSGPRQRTVTNTAPWITTVGASSIDRTFAADLILRDGQIFTGSSLYNGTWPDHLYVPLIYAGNASLYAGKASLFARFCVSGTLNRTMVEGAIVICDSGLTSPSEKERVVGLLGGLGVVEPNGPYAGESLIARPHSLPALTMTYSDQSQLLNYMGRRPNNQTTLARFNFRGTQVQVQPAPVLAFFSSRGPDRISNHVLKPDVIAPGVNILAAWPTLNHVAGEPEFNILSGTSMSCPHVSGIGALLKGAHPEWTPAMVKSAIMTTAYTNYSNGEPILDDFNYEPAGTWGIGSGHVDPAKAVRPGLVYDITEDDYFNFLCASGIAEPAIKGITQRKKVNCSGVPEEPWNINYPAIVFVIDDTTSYSPVHILEFRRTVTHVGENDATYTVAAVAPPGCTVVVEPEKMVFKTKYEKQSYVVKIYAAVETVDVDLVGKLTWTDDAKAHDVVSPIVITLTNATRFHK